MRMTIKKYGLAALICSVCCLSFIPLSFGEGKIPKPGTVIDKSNYMEYKHLFPEEHLPMFTDMWGLMDPISITVGESTQPKILKEVIEAGEKNRGKYELDAEGYVNAPTETIVGQPFYGVDTKDQNFAQKFMWNYDYNYMGDDTEARWFIQCTKRRNETRQAVDKVDGYTTYFAGRLIADPKPYIKNTANLRSGQMIRLLYPPVNKNIINLLLAHLDPRLENTGFVYVPAFRRVLRSESSERSTPISNSTQAPDDFNIFQGRIPEFNCKYLGEQTMLVVQNSQQRGMTLREAKALTAFPFDKKGWEPRKLFIIELTPKDRAYPQSKKRIYIDPESMRAFYGIAWDRAGSIWKVWTQSYLPAKCDPLGNQHLFQFIQWGADLQMGYTTMLLRGNDDFNQKYRGEADCTASAVRSLAK